MLSQRQLDANRHNAQLSTGPRTPKGRAAVAHNALRHGLTAQTTVLPNENPEEFRELCDSFFAEYHPAGPTETLLVEQMAISAWRLRRMRALETGLFAVRMSQLRDDDNNLDPRARAFAYDTSGSRSIETLSRYETRIERSFYKALHELERLRATSPVPEPPPPVHNSENQTHSQNRTPTAGQAPLAEITPPNDTIPAESASQQCPVDRQLPPLPAFEPHRAPTISGDFTQGPVPHYTSSPWGRRCVSSFGLRC